MPIYDYECPANDRTVEVRHGMDETLSTWGELCDRADVAPGTTSRSAPVHRAINRAVSIGAGATSAGPGEACGPGGCPCFPG
ncbi:MAG: zinc ribbon domain-containing protein [Phycisphaerales bacterium]